MSESVSAAKHISVARKSDKEWFIGTITNTEARNLELPLNFLDDDIEYKAKIYFDDKKYPSRTNVNIKEKIVNNKSIIELNLIPSGGAAIWIYPQ